MIIGLAGKKRSGKDTLYNYIKDKYKEYNFKRYAFGDPVKEACRLLFGFDDEQLYGDKKEELDEIGIKPREAFQKIGTEFGRKYLHELFPNLKVEIGEIWIEIFRRNCKNGNFIVTDVRFDNEAKAINDLGGIVIYIDSNYSLQDDHESEKIEIQYDFIIDNKGTLEEFYCNFDKIFANYVFNI